MHIKFNLALISDTTYNDYTGTKINEVITESGDKIDIIFQPKVLTEDRNTTVSENVVTRKVPTVMTKCTQCHWYKTVRKTECNACSARQFVLHEFCLAFITDKGNNNYEPLDFKLDSCVLIAGPVICCGPYSDKYHHIAWNRIYPQDLYFCEFKDFVKDMPKKHYPSIDLLPAELSACNVQKQPFIVTYKTRNKPEQSKCSEMPKLNLAWFADVLSNLTNFC